MSILDRQDPARALRLDLVEKIIVTLLLGTLAARLVPTAISSGDILPILLVGSEALVVAFMLLRRQTQDISLNWRDWLFGLSGTIAWSRGGQVRHALEGNISVSGQAAAFATID